MVAAVLVLVVTYFHSLQLELVVEVTLASLSLVYQQMSAAAAALVLPSELTHHVTLTTTQLSHHA